jgi:hypothetical protein
MNFVITARYFLALFLSVTCSFTLSDTQYVNVNGIVIQDGTVNIEQDAFYDSNLHFVSFPNSLESIGDAAFAGNHLTVVTFPVGLNYIGASAFTSNEITSIKIPYTVTDIAGGAFDNNSLTSVELPDGLTSINSYTFQGNNLSNINIPASVETIGVQAFNANHLQSLTIPYNVYLLDERSFASNDITEITFMGSRPSIYGNAFEGNPVSLIRYCPKTLGWADQTLLGKIPQLYNNCDSDDDGVINTQDAFAFNPSETLDTDNDGIGNNADTDDDNDGFLDDNDLAPLDETIGNQIYSIFDIDQNGSFDALTDALILLRYAFGLRGNSLVDGAIASDATRTSAADIEAYIESHMP